MDVYDVDMVYNVDTASPPAIELRGVVKAFSNRPVLGGVDLQVPRGSVLGLLGANGAGKSTLIRIMTGLLAPDSGAVHVDGVDAVRRRGELGSRVGIAPQDLGLYPQLTARENLVCFGEIAGLGWRAARRRADEVLELLGLTGQAKRVAGVLSGGQKRRLHTGIALVHRPRVLFLDEPTVGADVPSRAGILDVVRGMAAEGATVVYTTHYLPELEQLGARIAVLHQGRIAVDGPLREVVDRFARPSVRVRFHGGAPTVPGWRIAGDVLEPVTAVTDPGAALAALLAAPGVRTDALADVQVVRADLETAYLTMTGARGREEASDVARA